MHEGKVIRIANDLTLVEIQLMSSSSIVSTFYKDPYRTAFAS